jgi:flagellar operon protein
VIVNNQYFNHIGKVSNNPTAPITQKPTQDKGNFGKILQEEIKKSSDLKFSKHAEQRLQNRNIHLTQLQRDKISRAVDKAAEKGIKDSLVMVDNLAFVVNVKSKTVITAVNSSEMRDNIFTNIDGAVFA